MSPAVTEIAQLPLLPNTDLHSGEGKKLLDSALEITARQPGLQRLFWGRQVENADVLVIVIDWDSLAAHQTFQASPDYSFFGETVMPMLTGPPTVFHAKLPPLKTSAVDPFKAPVTECLSVHFPAEQDEDAWTRDSWVASQSAAEGLGTMGSNGGWSIEGHAHEHLGEGVEGKLFAAFGGWASLQAHGEAVKTEEFGKIKEKLGAGAVGVRVFHVVFEQYK